MDKIVIVNNGGQYVHRIWRSLRELEYESVMVPAAEAKDKIHNDMPSAIILSGGPTSVYDNDLGLSGELLDLSIPILGICWGHQFIAHYLGGKVKSGEMGEYGYSKIMVDDEDTILKGMGSEFQAWVSHRDEVIKLPLGFKALAHSESCKFEAMRHEKKDIFGVQFHPEVFHTQNGKVVLKNFAELSK